MTNVPLPRSDEHAGTDRGAGTVYPLNPPWHLRANTTYVIGVRDGEPYHEQFSGGDLPSDGRVIVPRRYHKVLWLVEREWATVAGSPMRWWYACEADPR